MILNDAQHLQTAAQITAVLIRGLHTSASTDMNALAYRIPGSSLNSEKESKFATEQTKLVIISQIRIESL